jgi:hypothetical protein
MSTYHTSGAIMKYKPHRFKTKEDLGRGGSINNMFASEQGMKCPYIERKKNWVKYKLFCSRDIITIVANFIVVKVCPSHSQWDIALCGVFTRQAK